MIISEISDELYLAITMNENAREEWLPSLEENFAKGLVRISEESCDFTLQYALPFDGKLWLPFRCGFERPLLSLKTDMWIDILFSGEIEESILSSDNPLQVAYYIGSPGYFLKY